MIRLSRIGSWPTIVSWPILLLAKVAVSWRYIKNSAPTYISWLLNSVETTNFSYDLTERNKQDLTNFVAQITGKKVTEIELYIRELDNNRSLKRHLLKHHHSPFFGRRIGWYAFIRATKPKVVVETGVERGLGACVIAEALRKNQAEGFPGEYYGTDIDPQAGLLFTQPYSALGKIIFGDSIESLKKLDKTIDLFISDSDHSSKYEAREYQTIRQKLSSTAIILADNAHATDALRNFSRLHKRSFLFFKEAPKDHWYPGAGIGASFHRL